VPLVYYSTIVVVAVGSVGYGAAVVALVGGARVAVVGAVGADCALLVVRCCRDFSGLLPRVLRCLTFCCASSCPNSFVNLSLVQK